MFSPWCVKLKLCNFQRFYSTIAHFKTTPSPRNTYLLFTSNLVTFAVTSSFWVVRSKLDRVVKENKECQTISADAQQMKNWLTKVNSDVIVPSNNDIDETHFLGSLWRYVGDDTRSDVQFSSQVAYPTVYFPISAPKSPRE